MNRRTIFVSVSVLALTVAGSPAQASPARSDAGAAGGLQSVATGLDRPWTSGGAPDGASVQTPPSAHDTQGAPLKAVDPATYAREKAAAATGPSPGRPQRVPVPQFAAAAAVPTAFNGLDRPGAANNGFVFNPPDTIVAKSPTRVLEGANSALRIFNTSGGVIQTLDLNTFFGAAVTNGRLFDPKVYFDRNATNPRFFAVALQAAGRGDANAANDVSRIWVAVSRSPNPANLAAGNWCRYNIDGRRDVGTAQASFADYPTIGAGRDSFSFSMNQFRFTNDTFTFADVRVWNKNVASNNAASCPSVPRFTFRPATTAGDFSRFTIQPAQHYTSPSSFTGTTNPAYYLSTTRGSSSAYRVYRVRNVAGGSPTMAQLVLTGASYGIPPSSPQPGSTVLIDTGDNRVLQVAGIGNTLVGTLTTVCNFAAGTPNESCSLTPRISVGQNATGGLTAAINENTFAGFGDGIFAHHQSLATNTALQSGSTWEFSGSGFSLSSAAMIKNVNAAWTGVQTYASGACSLPATAPSTTTARSGDYSGAQTDPGNVTNFWLAGEQAVTIGGSCQWRTRVALLVP